MAEDRVIVVRILDLIAVLRAGVPYIYFPNTFPAGAADDCCVAKLTGGGEPGRSVARPSFQLLVRAGPAATAEATAWNLFDYLNQKTNFDVGAVHVVFCLPSTSTPLFIGTDENGRSLYSLNFQAITEVP